MRILLAGATGIMGRQLVPLLTKAGHSVTGLTRRPGALAGTGATELVADVLDRPSVRSAIDGREFDGVIHAATGLAAEPRRYSGMRDTNRLRAEGTSTLIAAARATGATRLIVSSSTFGYGFGDFGDAPIDESAAFAEKHGGPVDAVFRALATNEQQARAFGGVALRYGLVYRGRGVIPSVASGWQGTLPLVHVEDAAAATVAALDARPGSVYNIVDDTPASWRELHEERARAFEAPDPAKLRPWLIRRTAPLCAELVSATSMRVSNARARDDLGWAPTFPSFREGVASDASAAQRAHVFISGRSPTANTGRSGAGAATEHRL